MLLIILGEWALFGPPSPPLPLCTKVIRRLFTLTKSFRGWREILKGELCGGSYSNHLGLSGFSEMPGSLSIGGNQRIILGIANAMSFPLGCLYASNFLGRPSVVSC